MKTKPKHLNLMAAIILATALALPLQIMLLYGHPPTEIAAIAIPTAQGNTAAMVSALSSNASTLATRQSIFGMLGCAANETRNGRNAISSMPVTMAVICMFRFGNLPGSGAERADWSRAAARFRQAFATIAGRTAVIAVMACHVVPVTGLGRRRRPHGVNNDGGWLA